MTRLDFPNLHARALTAPSRKVVFTAGPTLGRGEILELCPQASVRPPIRRGDLTSLLDEGFDVVAMIDGTYVNCPTVAAEEVLAAREVGCHVYGAASIGALRAAEFGRFGVQGVGVVYHWYRHGEIYRDDEVVVAMDSETFESHCDPMVNLRYACLVCMSEGSLEGVLAERILDIYGGYHFSERRYPRLIEELTKIDACENERAQIDSFSRALSERYEDFDIKAKDARLLVELLRQTYGLGRSGA